MHVPFSLCLAVAACLHPGPKCIHKSLVHFHFCCCPYPFLSPSSSWQLQLPSLEYSQTLLSRFQQTSATLPPVHTKKCDHIIPLLTQLLVHSNTQCHSSDFYPAFFTDLELHALELAQGNIIYISPYQPANQEIHPKGGRGATSSWVFQLLQANRIQTWRWNEAHPVLECWDLAFCFNPICQ